MHTYRNKNNFTLVDIPAKSASLLISIHKTKFASQDAGRRFAHWNLLRRGVEGLADCFSAAAAIFCRGI